MWRRVRGYRLYERHTSERIYEAFPKAIEGKARH